MFEMPLGTLKLGSLSRFFIVFTFVLEYRRTAARYIKINGTTIILHPQGRHYRNFFEFQVSLGSFVMSSVVFGDPWVALGAFVRPLGLHLSPLGGLFGRLWGVIGLHLSPLVVNWGRLWGSLEVTSGVTLRLFFTK